MELNEQKSIKITSYKTTLIVSTLRTYNELSQETVLNHTVYWTNIVLKISSKSSQGWLTESPWWPKGPLTAGFANYGKPLVI